ncbi:MAG TPA: Asp-tRNA(Asn)/Glu-tRNA(Gln) amidotransferase subunit GatC [Bacillota bacterium]|nr:Asp-tRNA(Asn)/Glu-tRNA(Gln) amidotransferase subunit GatC [Bacillota bacterium]
MITGKDFEYIAALSRLEFPEEEKESIIEQLNIMLEHINRIGGLDTEGIKPAYHIVPAVNVMRKDMVIPSMDRDKVLANAPDIREGCFRVPKIIK